MSLIKKQQKIRQEVRISNMEDELQTITGIQFDSWYTKLTDWQKDDYRQAIRNLYSKFRKSKNDEV